MRPFRCLLFAISLFGSGLPALAADEWVRLTTPHFEMYTLAGEKKGREAILYFEQVRSFVTEVTKTNWDQAVPVRIIAFNSEKQFRPYAPNEAAAAFYAGNQSRDYIVMEDPEPEHFPIAIHEYMHLVIRHSGIKLPTWLNEGWADVFSTLKPSGKNAMIGEGIKGHMQLLAQEKWLDFNTLTSVDQRSPNYNEKNRAGVFYAESWALAHMLYLGHDYHDGFPKFLEALNDGRITSGAIQIAYNRTPARVWTDLQAYLRQGTINVGIFPAKLEKSDEEAVLAPVSGVESGVVLADLLASTNKRDLAKAAYEKLAKQYPGTAEISNSLGYLAWQGGNAELARQYFEEALPKASDPQMCYHLAMMYHDAGQNDKVIAALEKAVSLKPDYTEARMQLGFANLSGNHFESAITAFSQIRKITQDKAATLFNGLAYAYAQAGDLDAARTNMENALKWAKTDSEKVQAEQLQRYLNARSDAAKRNAAIPVPVAAAATAAPAGQPEAGRPLLRRSPGTSPPELPAPVVPPPSLGELNPFLNPGETVKRVEGQAVGLDCEGAKAKFIVAVGAETLTFEISDPDRVMLKHDGANRFQFVCGSQKFPVAVEYVVDPALGKGIAGSVRKIEF
jgi:tetratricopeptide (TPR) repeat protein